MAIGAVTRAICPRVFSLGAPPARPATILSPRVQAFRIAHRQDQKMARFVKFSSAADPRLEVHINPAEVAAVRDSHGKTMIIFRGVAVTENVVGTVASVVAALEAAG